MSVISCGWYVGIHPHPACIYGRVIVYSDRIYPVLQCVVTVPTNEAITVSGRQIVVQIYERTLTDSNATERVAAIGDKAYGVIGVDGRVFAARQLSHDGIGFDDLLLSSRVLVILTAAGTIPILDVTICKLGS